MDLSEQTERMQSFYNLKHDPFGAVVDAMVFSGAGGRYEISETIRHLFAYSHQDSLLIGPNGSGKRTLALQVLKLLEEQWRVAWIDSTEIQTTSDLLKEINGQLGLGLKVDQSSEELVVRIIDIVASRYENEESFLIVVQFAEQLPLEVVDVLKRFRTDSNDIDQRIRQLWLSEDWSALSSSITEEDWYVHPLDPFTETDAEQYLKDRLIAAGSVGELPFAAKDIARLNQLAKGLPLALNEVAGDYLVSSTFKTAERKYSFPLTHVIAGIAALALVVIAVLYQTNESQLNQSTVKVETPLDSMTAVERKLAEAVAKVEAKQAEKQPTDESSENLAVNVDAESGDASEVESLVGLDEETVANVNVETPSIAVTSAVTSTSTSTPVATATPVTTDVKATSTSISQTTTPKPKTEPNVAKTSLFAVASDAEFTMQLIGVRERDKLEKLLPDFANPKLVDIVQTVHEGKPWFVLIYGRFATKAEATKAIGQIPSSVGVKEPWIRSFKSIRDSM